MGSRGELPVSDANIFGNILTRKTVEDAVLNTLELWIDTYLCEVERNEGIDTRSLPRPRSYARINTYNVFPDEQLPAVLIVSPGLSKAPVKQAQGKHRTYWQVNVVFQVSSTPDAVRDLAGFYTAAARAVFLQHQDLGGIGDGITWLTEKYNDAPDPARRSVASGNISLEVEVDDAVTAAAGPIGPDPIPDPTPEPGNWPEVQHTFVEVEKVEEIG